MTNSRLKIVLLLITIFLYHLTISLAQNPKIAIWGANGSEQAWVPNSLSNVKMVTSYGGSTVALLENGRIAAWGDNSFNQTNPPLNATNVVAIAQSSTHCLGLRSNGTAFVWGASPSGPSTNSPPPFSSIVAIAAGAQFSVCLRSDGSVLQYPFLPSGVLYPPFAAPSNLTNIQAISAGENVAMVLRSNGTVVVWGNPACTNTPPGLTNVKAIAAGDNHAVALRSNGTVVAWGENIWGQTNVPPGLSNVSQIAAGTFHNLALTSNGTVVAWGGGILDEASVPAGLTNVVSIAAGGLNSMALIGTGPVSISKQPAGQSILPGTTLKLGCTATGSSPMAFRWQRNGADIIGATNSTLTITNFPNAFAGDYRVIITNPINSVTSKVAQVTLGNLIGWGNDLFEELSIPASETNVTAISGQGRFNLTLNQNGVAKSWNAKIFTTPQAVSNVIAVAGGYSDELFLMNDGTVRAFGENNSGITNLPSGLTNVAQIVIGSSYALALRGNGTVVAWGSSGSGVTQIPASFTNIVAIACGGQHGMALRSNGTIAIWGSSSFGLSTVPAGLTNVVAIACGYYSDLALKDDGTVVVWGNGQTAPAGLNGVVAISAGDFNFLALRSNGSVVGFGNYAADPLNTVPPGVTNAVKIQSGSLRHFVIAGNGIPSFPTAGFDRSVRVGATFQLSSLAVGRSPMTYQWQLNGQNIIGETNANLRITNSPASAAGVYTVIVNNAFGSATNIIGNVGIIRSPITFVTNSFRYNAGTVAFSITGLAAAGPVVASASTNLFDWFDIATNPPVIGALTFTNLPTFTDRTFYRVSERQ